MHWELELVETLAARIVRYFCLLGRDKRDDSGGLSAILILAVDFASTGSQVVEMSNSMGV